MSATSSRTTPGFSPETFEFLEGLEQNNSRDWFDERRDVFKQRLHLPFAELLEEVSGRLSGAEVPVSGGEHTMFRINRDVRFSNDKSPYSTHVSGLLTPSGTKAESGGLVYVQLASDGGMAAGGLYKPDAKRLQPLRETIVEDPEEVVGVVEALRGRGLELDREDTLRSMPRGFAEHADHPQADLLKLKQFVVILPLPKKAWLDGSVADRLVTFAGDLAPLLRFVSRR